MIETRRDVAKKDVRVLNGIELAAKRDLLRDAAKIRLRQRLDQPQPRFGSMQLLVRTMAEEIHAQAEDGGLEVRFIATRLLGVERARLQILEVGLGLLS